MSFDEHAFKEKLEAAHFFPGIYTFKFIVKSEDQQIVESLLPEAIISVKPSSANTYVSVTLEAEMPSSQSVIEIYKQAKKIDGLIAL